MEVVGICGQPLDSLCDLCALPEMTRLASRFSDDAVPDHNAMVDSETARSVCGTIVVDAWYRKNGGQHMRLLGKRIQVVEL